MRLRVKIDNREYIPTSSDCSPDDTTPPRSSSRRTRSTLHPGLTDKPRKKQATVDVRLHVVKKKKMPNNGINRIPQFTPFTIHETLKGINLFRHNLEKRIDDFINSDYFKGKTEGKTYKFDKTYGIHGWESNQKKKPVKTHNAIELDVSTSGVFDSHVKMHGIQTDCSDEHYTIDLLILALEDATTNRGPIDSSIIVKKRKPSDTASSVSSSGKKKKIDASRFKAPDIVKVHVLMPTVSDNHGLTVVPRKEPIFHFYISNFVDDFIKAPVDVLDDSDDDLVSLDDSFDLEYNDGDDEFNENTKMILRNWLGFEITNYKQKSTVRSYNGVIGRKSELFGGTGTNKNMEPLRRSHDVNAYLKKMASKKKNWYEMNIEGSAPGLAKEDRTNSVLEIYLSLGSKQDDDELVQGFWDPTDDDVEDLVGFSQNELDVPSDQFDKKKSAQQTKDRATLCKEFFAKLYSRSGSIWYYGFTSNARNIMYQSVVNDTSLQKIYCNDILPSSETDPFIERCKMACTQSKELHGLLPCKNDFPPEDENIHNPPSLMYWKTTPKGSAWWKQVQEKQKTSFSII